MGPIGTREGFQKSQKIKLGAFWGILDNTAVHPEGGSSAPPLLPKSGTTYLVPKFSYLETLSYKLSEKKVSTKFFFFSPRSRPDKLLDFFSLKSLFRDNDQSLQHTQTPQNHQKNLKKSKKQACQVGHPNLSQSSPNPSRSFSRVVWGCLMPLLAKIKVFDILASSLSGVDGHLCSDTSLITENNRK